MICLDLQVHFNRDGSLIVSSSYDGLWWGQVLLLLLLVLLWIPTIYCKSGCEAKYIINHAASFTLSNSSFSSDCGKCQTVFLIHRLLLSHFQTKWIFQLISHSVTCSYAPLCFFPGYESSSLYNKENNLTYSSTLMLQDAAILDAIS